MNSPKLLEAIAELEAQRAIIDDAIIHLKRAHASLNGQLSEKTQVPAEARSFTTRKTPRYAIGGRGSFVNEAVQALESNGKPLHIREIVNHIRLLRGEAPVQSSVGAALAREEARAKEAKRTPRVVKVGRNMFDIPREVQEPLQLAN